MKSINLKKDYFFIGLTLFYLILFFSPSKLSYFSAYLIIFFIFYLGLKSIQKSLIFSLILSFFTELGLASSWFKLEPTELGFISGYSFTPFTFLSLILLVIFIFNHDYLKPKAADILLFLFFLWNIFIFIIFPNVNVLYGIISLTEISIGYYFLRLYISAKDFLSVFYLLISSLIFQIVLGIYQLLIQRNVGLIGEASTYISPFGTTTSEDENLFRITGGFGHANTLAVVLLGLIPFLFIFKKKRFDILKIFSFLTLFFTYSRAAWFICFPIVIILLWKFNHRFNKNIFIKRKWIKALILFLIIILIWPVLSARLRSIPQTFDENGSIDVRVKLIQESLNLIQLYPVTGIGTNRFQQIASENSITEIFARNGISPSTQLHNLYAEVAVSAGLPGLFIFLLLFISVLFHYFLKKRKNTMLQKGAFYGFIGLLLVSAFHPLYLTVQFRLFFLLSAIILVDTKKTTN